MEGMNTTLQLNNGGMKKKINVKRGIFLACLLALSVSHFLIFWVYMNFETVRLTFFEYNMYNELEFIGFERYVDIFKDFFIEENNQANLNIFFNTFKAGFIRARQEAMEFKTHIRLLKVIKGV